MIDFLIKVLQKFKTFNFAPLIWIGIIIVTFFAGLFSLGNYVVMLFEFKEYFTIPLTQRGGGLLLVSAIIVIIRVMIRIIRDLINTRYLGSSLKQISLLTIYSPLIFVLFFFGLPEGFSGQPLEIILKVPYLSHLWYQQIPFALVLCYPLLCLLGGKSSNSFLKRFFLNYNLGYFFIISILGSFSFFGSEGVIWIFFAILPMIVTRAYLSIAYPRILNRALGIVYLVISMLLFFQVPESFETFTIEQMNKAAKILHNEGNNYAAYQKAGGLRFLEQGFRQWGHNSETFQKLFDSTAEEFYGDKMKDTTLVNNRATDASKVGKNAKVEMGVVSIEHRIVNSGSSVPIMMTVYDMYFHNTTDQNQEVIMNFEAPSDISVVSDLKLGLDLQFQGQVASRGAARKVYEDSLRINKDPALIEKVGISTYNLRVFPIPSKLDSNTNGKQRVQLTMLTPVSPQDRVVYAPKFSLINLKTSPDSSFITKIYKDKQLVKEDIKKDKEIDSYMASTHQLDTNILNSLNPIPLESQCIARQMQSNALTVDLSDIIAMLSGADQPLLNEKMYLFFDNSKSVERNKANKEYQSLATAIKNYDGKLQDVEIYSYNFQVEPLAKIEDIKFWGYSDVDAVLSFIEKNNIQNSRIILITDDDSFNFTVTENTNRNLEQLISNQFNVIKIGDDIKKYKSDIISILGATQGNIYSLGTDQQSREELFKTLFGESRKLLRFCNEGEAMTGQSVLLNKIYAGYLASRMMRSVKGRGNWDNVAALQGKLADTFAIVTQFSSMIALENDQQQRDLKHYEQQSDKFKSDFNNNTINTQGGTRDTSRRSIDSNNNDRYNPTDRRRRMALNSSLGEESMDTSRKSTIKNDENLYINTNKKSYNSIDLAGAGMAEKSIGYSLFRGNRVNISRSLWILLMYIIRLYHIYLMIRALIFGEKDIKEGDIDSAEFNKKQVSS